MDLLFFILACFYYFSWISINKKGLDFEL